MQRQYTVAMDISIPTTGLASGVVRHTSTALIVVKAAGPAEAFDAAVQEVEAAYNRTDITIKRVRIE